jgi:hypothetical protein
MQKKAFNFEIGKLFKIKITNTYPEKNSGKGEQKVEDNLTSIDHCCVINMDYDRFLLFGFRTDGSILSHFTVWKDGSLTQKNHLKIHFLEEITKKNLTVSLCRNWDKIPSKSKFTLVSELKIKFLAKEKKSVRIPINPTVYKNSSFQEKLAAVA